MSGGIWTEPPLEDPCIFVTWSMTKGSGRQMISHTWKSGQAFRDLLTIKCEQMISEKLLEKKQEKMKEFSCFFQNKYIIMEFLAFNNFKSQFEF